MLGEDIPGGEWDWRGIEGKSRFWVGGSEITEVIPREDSGGIKEMSLVTRIRFLLACDG